MLFYRIFRRTQLTYTWIHNTKHGPQLMSVRIFLLGPILHLPNYFYVNRAICSQIQVVLLLF